MGGGGVASVYARHGFVAVVVRGSRWVGFGEAGKGSLLIRDRVKDRDSRQGYVLGREAWCEGSDAWGC